VEKGEQVTSGLGKLMCCPNTKILVSSNKTSKNEGEELAAVLMTTQEQAKTVRWEGVCSRARP